MKSDLNGRSGRNQRVALCRKPPPQIRPEGDRIAQNWIRHQSLTSNDRFDSMGFCHLPPYYNTKDGSSPAESVYQSRPQRPAFLGRLVPSACIFADETRPTTSNLRCIHLAKICIPEGGHQISAWTGLSRRAASVWCWIPTAIRFPAFMLPSRCYSKPLPIGSAS